MYRSPRPLGLLIAQARRDWEHAEKKEGKASDAIFTAENNTPAIVPIMDEIAKLLEEQAACGNILSGDKLEERLAEIDKMIDEQYNLRLAELLKNPEYVKAENNFLRWQRKCNKSFEKYELLKAIDRKSRETKLGKLWGWLLYCMKVWVEVLENKIASKLINVQLAMSELEATLHPGVGTPQLEKLYRREIYLAKRYNGVYRLFRLLSSKVDESDYVDESIVRWNKRIKRKADFHKSIEKEGK